MKLRYKTHQQFWKFLFFSHHQACNCNSTGTVSSTTCKNDINGHCICKTGVTGRQCDSCLKQYADFGPSGCRRKFKD